MGLNLLKLCVGADSIEDLTDWIGERRRALAAAGEKPEHVHVTRMIPRRRDEILGEGSLYWVIKGNVQCRQRLLDIEPFTAADGIERCRLVLDETVVPTVWQPRRAFQGWRYLDKADAPVDLAAGNSWHALPPDLRRELADLGLL